MRNLHHALRRNILQNIDFFYTPFKKIMPLQTFRYAASGGVNTVFDISLFTLSYHFVFNKRNLGLGPLTLSPHIAALFFAFCFSLPSGFYLNRYIVFQNTGLQRHAQMVRYIAVALICVVFNYLFLKLFVDYFGWYATPSKILTTLLIIIFSYTSQTYFFFKLKPHKQP
jgi:putative flippase GtrA